jgi:hypothetical protein
MMLLALLYHDCLRGSWELDSERWGRNWPVFVNLVNNEISQALPYPLCDAAKFKKQLQITLRIRNVTVIILLALCAACREEKFSEMTRPFLSNQLLRLTTTPDNPKLRNPTAGLTSRTFCQAFFEVLSHSQPCNQYFTGALEQM